MRGSTGNPNAWYIAPRWLMLCTWIALLLCGLMRLTQAAPVANAFDNANKLYEQGNYLEAADAYATILAAGQGSEAIFFNLGNAFFKANQLGRAIAAYRQAEQFAPRDPDLRANLQFARNQVQGPTLARPAWQRWLGKLSLNEWTVLAAGALWVWLLMLTTAQVRPAWKPALRGSLLALGAAAALFCACFGMAFQQNRVAQGAIAVVRELPVRQSPLDIATTAFTAHDGAEFQVFDRKDEWLQVRADARRSGWVKREQVLVFPAEPTGGRASPRAQLLSVPSENGAH